MQTIIAGRATARARLLVLVGLTALGLSFLPTTTSYADERVVTVTTTDDGELGGLGVACPAAGDDECTLRAAVQTANADTSIDTVEVPAGTYRLTIEDDDDPDNGSSGDLLATADVTIRGAGADATTIDAEDLDNRHLRATRDASLTVESLALINGSVDVGAHGGAIRVEGNGDLHLRDVLLRDNTAEQSGGAVSVSDAGTVVATGSVFEGNAATDGGALAAADATIQDSHFRDNSADVRGGAINVTGGALDLTDSDVEDNAATWWGGGVYVANSVATIDDTVIRDNVAGENGGGVFSETSQTTVTASTISGNEAFHGAGAFTWDMSHEGETGAHLLIDRSTVHDNEAGRWGGGVYSERYAEAEVRNSTLSGNRAGHAGGAAFNAYNWSSLTLRHSTVADTGGETTAVHQMGEDDWEVFAAASDASAAQVEQPMPGDGQLRLSHVVVAGTDGDNCGGDLPHLLSDGHNLDDDGSCDLDADGDVQAEALLGDLADNGGPTLTHLPAGGSPAIEGGAADCDVEVDQRGIARPQGSACDIGAVEVDPTGPPPIEPDPDRPFGCDPDAAERFGDVPRPYVHRDPIGCLADLGFVVGFNDGTYGPNLDMSRGQFATVVMRMIEFIAGEELDDAGPAFPDVPDHHVHAEGIAKLAAAGLIRGFEDGDFRPGESLERGQAASILDASITLATGQQLPDGPDAFRDDDGSPHEDALDRLAQEGIVLGVGDGVVRPNDEIKRGQLASMVVRTLVTIEGLTIG